MTRTVVGTEESPWVSTAGPKMRAEAPPEAFRQEALLLFRMGRRGEAEAALDKCEKALWREEEKFKSMAGAWSQTLSYLASEKEWVSRARRR